VFTDAQQQPTQGKACNQPAMSGQQPQAGMRNYAGVGAPQHQQLHLPPASITGHQVCNFLLATLSPDYQFVYDYSFAQTYICKYIYRNIYLPL
jgi:hypothetical protein